MNAKEETGIPQENVQTDAQQQGTVPADIQAMTFEQGINELEDITRKIESGQGTLDDAISAYERGTQLHRHCATKLEEAQARIERVTRKEDGSLSTEPTDIG